jgi:hypothetical protein
VDSLIYIKKEWHVFYLLLIIIIFFKKKQKEREVA